MKAAPAAERALRVLSYLTVNPRTEYTLSELSAALGVGPASMSSLLLALSDAGYLARHPRRKTYHLGMSAVALGNAAQIRHPVVDLARAEMAALAELGSACVGSAIVGDEIVVLALTGRATTSTREIHLGQRLPLLPPYGQSFLAWSPDDLIEGWLAELGVADASNLTGLRRSLAYIRSTGYTIVLDSERVAAVQRLFGDLARDPWDPVTRDKIRRAIIAQADAYSLTDVDPEGVYAVDHVAAPVFGFDGEVVYVLTVHGVGEVDAATLGRIGRQVADAGLTLTGEIGGRVPAGQ